ncbi:hypothetical protein Sgleb_23360 [Streptomyces glebosus]|uniref:Uncharacterized protein n=1 Tax=Streptomyces glebosus TaxID=249580 RepID=A0A640SS61_9ACTN|nr:hypothetical protein Sgleb_23360 [Streptomyces glebosus]GHG54700.1 hypothetical protein GCM10010513_16180 [Streptomyces glebosus]
MDILRGCMGPSSPLGGPFRKAIRKAVRSAIWSVVRSVVRRAAPAVGPGHFAGHRGPCAHPAGMPVYVREHCPSGPEEDRSAAPRRTVVLRPWVPTHGQWLSLLRYDP